MPAILNLFNKYRIAATWATASVLFSRTREDLLAASPAVRDAYLNRRLCPYEGMASLGADGETDPYRYAPSPITMISRQPFREIGSHTYSHYYCLEPGQDRGAFEADLESSIAVARREGITIRSLIFPGNQVNEAYLDSCARSEICAHRGNLRNWMYRPGDSSLKRLLRFADSYVALSGDLRPYSKRLTLLDGLRLRRIRRGLSSAAKNRQIYHEWRHSHNFGVNVRENLAFLEDVLRHFDIRGNHGMESLKWPSAPRA